MSHKITTQLKKQFKTGSATELSNIIDFRIKGVKTHDCRTNDRVWKLTCEAEDAE